MAQKGKLIHIRLFSSNGRFDFQIQSNSSQALHDDLDILFSKAVSFKKQAPVIGC